MLMKRRTELVSPSAAMTMDCYGITTIQPGSASLITSLPRFLKLPILKQGTQELPEPSNERPPRGTYVTSAGTYASSSAIARSAEYFKPPDMLLLALSSRSRPRQHHSIQLQLISSLPCLVLGISMPLCRLPINSLRGLH